MPRGARGHGGEAELEKHVAVDLVSDAVLVFFELELNRCGARGLCKCAGLLGGQRTCACPRLVQGAEVLRSIGREHAEGVRTGCAMVMCTRWQTLPSTAPTAFATSAKRGMYSPMRKPFATSG